MRTSLMLAIACLTACGEAPMNVADTDNDTTLSVAGSSSGKADDVNTNDDRSTKIHLPPGYDPKGAALPFIISLHGWASDQDQFERYIQLAPLADQKNFILARPNGHFVGLFVRGWDATDACCGSTSEDDVEYISNLIDTAKQKYNIDPAQVHVIGHSNGGYMAHRLACELADKIGSIVSLSGETWKDPAKCTPSRPISVVEAHATGDGVRPFDGGAFFNSNDPSAKTTLENWTKINKCVDPSDKTTMIWSIEHFLKMVVNGSPLGRDAGQNDTTVTEALNCPPGIATELWTINGASHQPDLTVEGRNAMVDFLLSHPQVTPAQ